MSNVGAFAGLLGVRQGLAHGRAQSGWHSLGRPASAVIIHDGNRRRAPQGAGRPKFADIGIIHHRENDLATRSAKSAKPRPDEAAVGFFSETAGGNWWHPKPGCRSSGTMSGARFAAFGLVES